ncbi:Ulp1 protease family, C-terminal catalytic domain [Cinara cedri]|uniref:Ulp1 protease family, C-terminal catalytic domain n=1 Tax=Cinara cedri TaxID=506608 RepID=A0A5E4NFJ8_9HEMI|nr:Ulp1 protease family, C-terminal catalytic domain [Cinara cedri]
MGILNVLWNITKWFTDKTGITRPKESLKRKNDECEIISNKKMRMEDSLVEVVEIGDESLTEGEEVEIIEPGPSDVPLRANPPLILDGRLNQNQIMSPIDLTESSDEENIIKVDGSSSLSNQLCLNGNASMNKNTSNSFEDKCTLTSSIKETRNLNLSMERRFSALKMNDSSVDENTNKILTKIIKHLILPKVETIETPISISRPMLNTQNKHDSNQFNLPQTSSKENSVIPELSFHTNRVIKHECFYDRILRKFKETQAAVALATPKVQHKSPDEILNEKLEIMHEQLNKIKLPIRSKDVFPGYSNDKIEFIKCEMRKPNGYITKGQNIKLSDLNTVFSSKAWLNDEVINHYMSMIVERDPDSLHMFNTFFYFKLSDQGYKSVSRWSRRKDIFKCKKIFIPIHLGNHWCLIYVDFAEKSIKYYDSLGGTNSKCLNIIFGYLKEEYENKKNEKFNCSGWNLVNIGDCPIQKNSYDCGVFTCINAEYLSRDAKLDFTQADMPKLRYRMCYEILNNKLCY